MVCISERLSARSFPTQNGIEVLELFVTIPQNPDLKYQAERIPAAVLEILRGICSGCRRILQNPLSEEQLFP
jgi:hypothetical protein